jgi:hypothetical protein
VHLCSAAEEAAFFMPEKKLQTKRKLSTNAIGEAAEMKFMARAADLGLAVSRPMSHNSPYDVIVEANGRLLRIQVKCTHSKRFGTIFPLNVRHAARSQKSDFNSRVYQPDEIDFIAGYVGPVDAWYIIPVRAIGKRYTLLVHPYNGNGIFEPYRERWDLLLNPPPQNAQRRPGAPS